MTTWTEKWVKIGLSTERADRPRFEAAVAACYRYSGLKEPRAIIWTPCPIVAVYAGSIATAVLRRLGQEGASVRDSALHSVRDSALDSALDSMLHSVSTSVDASVRASVSASVRDSVHDNVGARVDASVDAGVGTIVYDSVQVSVHDSVNDSVDASVGASVRDSVLASVNDSVGASVNDSVGTIVHDSVQVSVHASVADSVADSGADSDLKQWHLYSGGQFWASSWGWWGPAAVSFALDVLRLDIGREQELKARAYAATCDSACWWWPHSNFVVVSERPVMIEKHQNGKLKEARWEWRDKGKYCEWSVKP
jgi:hypothetical protein